MSKDGFASNIVRYNVTSINDGIKLLEPGLPGEMANGGRRRQPEGRGGG